VCLCKASVSGKTHFAPSNQAPVSDSRHHESCCALFIYLCLCLYVHVYPCVMKVISIDKYQQNRDDVTCNLEVELEIDAHSDVKQAAK